MNNFFSVVPGALVGGTAYCLIRHQFSNLKNGDRFFYTRPNHFTPRQLAAIKKTTFARYSNHLHTSLVFKWSICVWMSNGPVFEWWSEKWIDKSLFVVLNG